MKPLISPLRLFNIILVIILAAFVLEAIQSPSSYVSFWDIPRALKQKVANIAQRSAEDKFLSPDPVEPRASSRYLTQPDSSGAASTGYSLKQAATDTGIVVLLCGVAPVALIVAVFLARIRK